MANAEIKVVLVGDDAEQQAAFDSPSFDSDVGDFAQKLKDLIASTEAAGGQDSTELPSSPTAATAEDVSINRLIESMEKLVNKISELIEKDQRTTQPPQPKPGDPVTPKDSEWLTKWVTKRLESFGVADTRFGRSVRGVSARISKIASRTGKTLRAAATRFSKTRTGKVLSAFGKRVAKTKLGQAVGRVGGRVLSALGVRAAGAGATTAVAGVAGTGAAATVASGGILLPVAVAATAATVAFTAAAYSVKKLSDAVHSIAEDLKDLSPEIAMVTARFEANRQIARLDRARTIGPEVAQLEAARNRISESMYELQTKIYALLLKGSPILEAVLNGVNAGIVSVDVVRATLVMIWELADDKLLGKDADPNENKNTRKALDDAFKRMTDALKGQGQPDWQGIDPQLLAMFQGKFNPPLQRGNNPPLQPNRRGFP